MSDNTIKIGAGPIYSSGGRTWNDWKLHALGAYTHMTNSRLGFRIDGWVGETRSYFGGQGGLSLGGSAGLQLGWRTRRTAPYVLAGISYNHTPVSSSKPLAHDFGTSLIVGFEAETGTRRWFLELSPRFFGNVFRERDVTRTIMPVTVGLVF